MAPSAGDDQDKASVMENVLMQLPTTGIECRGVRKGAWTPEEDLLLKRCIEKYGEGRWHLVPTRAGLRRCRKSCRLRWLNYLKPTIRRGTFDEDEVDLIIRLHRLLGNRWSLIAGRIPGRTANDIKNYWNSSLSKKVNPNWPQGVAHNNVPGRSSAAERNPSPLTEEYSYPLKEHTPCSHPSGVRGSTPNAAPPSPVIIRPQPRIPSKTSFPLPMVINTSHKTRCDPSAADDNADKEEYSLSWLKNLLGDDGEDEEQRPQQWEQEHIVSFTSHSRAGEVELLDGGHWTEEIECWEQWGLKDTSGGAHQPAGLLQPEPRIPTTTAFPSPMTDTCHKSGHNPSATDGEAAQLEDPLPWLRKLPWDKDEEEEEQEQEQQGEPKIIVSFPDRSQEGAADDLDTNPFWSDVISGWGWGAFENVFLGAHLPPGLLHPDVDGTNQAPNGNDGN